MAPKIIGRTIGTIVGVGIILAVHQVDNTLEFLKLAFMALLIFLSVMYVGLTASLEIIIQELRELKGEEDGHQ